MSGGPGGKPASPASTRGDPPTTDAAGEDEIRRDYERRALRNVRRLVDSLQKQHRDQDRLERRAVWLVVLVGVLLSLVVAMLLVYAGFG